MQLDMKKGFATQAIHGDFHLDDHYRALNTPIYQNATFEFETTQQGGQRFAGAEDGYIYSRLGNPTTSMVEARIALLEQGEAAVAFSSGMGAISSTVWTFLQEGDHVVADTTLYGCTYTMFEGGCSRFGVDTTFVDMSDLEALKGALKENTTMVYFETPANPNMKIIDIDGVVAAAREHSEEITIVVDNTFATPYLQRPLTQGVDVVVHSATKYLNGHGDVIAGFAVGSENAMAEVRGFGLKDMTGAVQSPNDSFLILRGLKTLELRMERHCDNAEKLACWLAEHPQVETVYFPGLESHPGHAIAKKQMDRFGGMLAFEVKGGYHAGAKLLDNVQLAVLAVSLGDAETLVEHPASMTHSTYTPEERAASGIPEGLVRVSCGLENIQDILADFEQAFDKL